MVGLGSWEQEDEKNHYLIGSWFETHPTSSYIELLEKFKSCYTLEPLIHDAFF